MPVISVLQIVATVIILQKNLPLVEKKPSLIAWGTQLWGQPGQKTAECNQYGQTAASAASRQQINCNHGRQQRQPAAHPRC